MYKFGVLTLKIDILGNGMASEEMSQHNIFFNDVIFYDVFRLKLDTLVNGMASEEMNTTYLIQTGELLSGKKCN
jgi:hypothetical protein